MENEMETAVWDLRFGLMSYSQYFPQNQWNGSLVWVYIRTVHPHRPLRTPLQDLRSWDVLALQSLCEKEKAECLALGLWGFKAQG